MIVQKSKLLAIALTFAFSSSLAMAQGKITSPKEEFGFNIGDDYQLVNYSRLAAYWKKLDSQSDRLVVTEIGKTAEGRPLLMAIISSPKNIGRLGDYRNIARRLALAQVPTDAEARQLAAEGRTVVWIDGGLHSTEVLGSQQLIELVYQLASRSDEETTRILRDVILLAVCSNPDGLELVADWYMRESDPAKRSMSGLPRLYHKYIGHDNNRDFYMVTQPETEAINRVLYGEWFPQILYNHHQTGPAGTVLFAPPFRDPFNYYFDPLVPTGIELVSAAIHNRFVAEGKPGATMRQGARYSTWWSGGLRSTSYFHNVIGILTEAIGNPTPMEIPFLPQRQLAKGDLPFPVAPQKWHFRQSIEYALSADRAILDIASRYRADFLYNIYRMAKNSIDRGSRDHWTIQPKQIAAVEAAIEKDKIRPAMGFGGPQGYPKKYYDLLFDPSRRDPRGYILPSDQPDFLTATKFVNALIKCGVTICQAKSAFEVSGKKYPQGSYVIKSAQAYRPHIMAMFEPQDHPHDFQYPGGPPISPYDSAGWTLAFQMGVFFDRILDAFDGPFEKISGLAQAPPGAVSGEMNPAGFLLSHQANDAFIAANRLLREGESAFWLKEAFELKGKAYPPGTMYIPAGPSTPLTLQKMARELGLHFEGVAAPPSSSGLALRPVRIGLWDSYGGSMPSGWIRWLLERYEFPFEVVYPPELDAGRLASRFDVLIFPGGAIPSLARAEEGEREFRGFPQPDPENIPPEYRGRLGFVTAQKTIPELRQFLEDGGTILAIGSSTSIAYHLQLPVANLLVEKLPDGTEKPLPGEKYFIPGSVLQTRVDNSDPLAYGLGERVDVFFNNSPVFALKPDAPLSGVKPVAWFETKSPLRSGWAWGQHYLEGGVAVISAAVGKGKLFLFGPEITFRAQPHGTFKFLFNGIFAAKVEDVVLK